MPCGLMQADHNFFCKRTDAKNSNVHECTFFGIRITALTRHEAAALQQYAIWNEIGLKAGNDISQRYRDEMSVEQECQLAEARSRCEGAINHPLRHFTGGFSCFSPF